MNQNEEKEEKTDVESILAITNACAFDTGFCVCFVPIFLVLKLPAYESGLFLFVQLGCHAGVGDGHSSWGCNYW